VQQRIIRLQRGRPFVACDRLVEPPELGEGRAEKAMARRSVRHQLEFPEHSGLGLFEPALAQKRVGAVDMRFGEIGGERNRAISARQSGRQRSLFDLHRREVAVCYRVIGFERDRAFVGLGRLRPFAQRL
jgi:hypothetical protein